MFRPTILVLAGVLALSVGAPLGEAKAATLGPITLPQVSILGSEGPYEYGIFRDALGPFFIESAYFRSPTGSLVVDAGVLLLTQAVDVSEIGYGLVNAQGFDGSWRSGVFDLQTLGGDSREFFASALGTFDFQAIGFDSELRIGPDGFLQLEILGIGGERDFFRTNVVSEVPLPAALGALLAGLSALGWLKWGLVGLLRKLFWVALFLLPRQRRRLVA